MKGSSKDGRIYYCERDYPLGGIYIGAEFAPLDVKEDHKRKYFDRGMNYRNFNVIRVQKLNEVGNEHGLSATKLFG